MARWLLQADMARVHRLAHLVAVVVGRSDDLGTLLRPPGCYGFSNIWSADHAEVGR